MKARFLLGFLVLCVQGCSRVDKASDDCEDTTVQCTSDASCANYPGTTCGPQGVCTSCSNVGPPDAMLTSCVSPLHLVKCHGPGDCANYPGTICRMDGTCGCAMTTCAPPGLACTSDGDCGNYPGTMCGPDGTCACAIP